MREFAILHYTRIRFERCRGINGSCGYCWNSKRTSLCLFAQLQCLNVIRAGEFGIGEVEKGILEILIVEKLVNIWTGPTENLIG